MHPLYLIIVKRAAAAPAAPAPAAGASPAPAAPAAPAPPNPVNAPSIAPTVPNGFTMQLPQAGGALQPTVDQTGQPIDANGQPLPPPEPVEQPEPKKGPQSDELALYSPGMLISGMVDRVKKATSSQFLGPLDASSPTGLKPGVPAMNPPGVIKPGQTGSKIYDFVRKGILAPLLQRGKTPFGGVSGRNDRFAAPLYEAADQLQAVSSPKNPNLSLLANWAGGAIGNALGSPGAGDDAGGMIDRGVDAFQNAGGRF